MDNSPDAPGSDVITPLGHRTVEEALVEELRDAIVTGSLRPGDRLVYRDLARRFGVSVTPVRIALRELSKEGLVEMRAHAGARVSLLSIDELEEIFVTRIGIEGWLAQHGAERLTDEGTQGDGKGRTPGAPPGRARRGSGRLSLALLGDAVGLLTAPPRSRACSSASGCSTSIRAGTCSR